MYDRKPVPFSWKAIHRIVRRGPRPRVKDGPHIFMTIVRMQLIFLEWWLLVISFPMRTVLAFYLSEFDRMRARMQELFDASR